MQSSITYDIESTVTEEKIHWGWSELRVPVKDTEKVKKKEIDLHDGNALAPVDQRDPAC